MIWDDRLKAHGGRMFKGHDEVGTTYDGVQYEYRALFNDDESIDAFLEEHNIQKSDRDFIGTYLTLFFSTPA